MKAPCKNCPDRTVNCHSKCERYIQFDNENKIRREERVKQINDRDYSPNKVARIRKNELNKMRGNK